MKFNKYLTSGLAVALTFMATSFNDVSVASAEEAVQADTAATQEVANTFYRYTSKRYGYSITTPVKPVGIISAANFFGDERKGDVLIFENEGFNVKKAWVILPEAFLPEDIPDNLNSMTASEKQKAVETFANKRGWFEYVEVAKLEDGKAGFYCVTAKEVEVDTTGDGVADQIMVADNQSLLTYFKGDFGGCFVVELLQDGTLTDEARAEYEMGLQTFHQWPTTMQE